MADEKVVFDGRGDYQIGEELTEMDVKGEGAKTGTGSVKKARVFGGGNPSANAQEKPAYAPKKFDVNALREVAGMPSSTEEEAAPEPPTVATEKADVSDAETVEIPAGEVVVPPAPSLIRALVPEEALQEMGLVNETKEGASMAQNDGGSNLNLNALMRGRRNSSSTPSTKPSTESKAKAEEEVTTKVAEEQAVSTPESVGVGSAPTEVAESTPVVEGEKPSESVPAPALEEQVTGDAGFSMSAMDLTHDEAKEPITTVKEDFAAKMPVSTDGKFVRLDSASFIADFTAGENARKLLLDWVIKACKFKVTHPTAIVEIAQYPGLKLYGVQPNAGTKGRFTALIGCGDAVSAISWNNDMTLVDASNKVVPCDVCAGLAGTPMVLFKDRQRKDYVL